MIFSLVEYFGFVLTFFNKLLFNFCIILVFSLLNIRGHPAIKRLQTAPLNLFSNFLALVLKKYLLLLHQLKFLRLYYLNLNKLQKILQNINFFRCIHLAHKFLYLWYIRFSILCKLFLSCIVDIMYLHQLKLVRI